VLLVEEPAVEQLAVGSTTLQSPARGDNIKEEDPTSSPVLKKSKKARKNGNYMDIKNSNMSIK